MATRLTTGEAAQEKQCSRNAIRDAIGRRALDGEQVGKFYFVRVNRKFQEWEPNPRRQKAGRDSQNARTRSGKKAKRTRKTK